MRFSMLGLSLNIICASAQYVEGTAWARGTFDRCVLARLPRAQIVSGYCIHMRIKAIFQNGTNSFDVIPRLNSAQQDKPTGSTLWTSADGKVSSRKDGYEWSCKKSFIISSLLNKSNILRKQSLSPDSITGNSLATLKYIYKNSSVPNGVNLTKDIWR